MTVVLTPDQLGFADWLYRNADVVRRVDREDGGIELTLDATAAARLEIEERLSRKNSH